MKKLFLTLIAGFILISFAGCNKSGDTVTIITDINLYTPAMSSVKGITMTPDFKTEKNYEKLVYYWTTSEGEFFGSGKEVKNQGEAVIWWAVSNDKVVEINKPFDVKLEVIDGENQKILSNTKLTITPDKGFYKVKH